MTDAANEELTIRYAVRSDIGLERADNEDAAYAGSRLLAIASLRHSLRPAQLWERAHGR
jgi:hypothetical protein